MESNNNIEDEKSEKTASDWCGRSVSPNKTSKKLELTRPLYSGHDWRTMTSNGG